MKILNKIKKIIIGIGLFLYTLPSKMLAYSYGMIDKLQPDYGVPHESPIYESTMWKVFQFILLPIILLIGLVIYIKKSKSSKKRKIAVVIIAVIALILIYIIGDKIMKS